MMSSLIKFLRELERELELRAAVQLESGSPAGQIASVILRDVASAVRDAAKNTLQT